MNGIFFRSPCIWYWAIILRNQPIVQCFKLPFSFPHHYQGRIDFNTVNPSHSTGMDLVSIPASRGVLANPIPRDKIFQYSPCRELSTHPCAMNSSMLGRHSSRGTSLPLALHTTMALLSRFAARHGGIKSQWQKCSLSARFAWELSVLPPQLSVFRLAK